MSHYSQLDLLPGLSVDRIAAWIHWMNMHFPPPRPPPKMYADRTFADLSAEPLVLPKRTLLQKGENRSLVTRSLVTNWSTSRAWSYLSFFCLALWLSTWIPFPPHWYQMVLGSFPASQGSWILISCWRPYLHAEFCLLAPAWTYRRDATCAFYIYIWANGLSFAGTSVLGNIVRRDSHDYNNRMFWCESRNCNQVLAAVSVDSPDHVLLYSPYEWAIREEFNLNKEKKLSNSSSYDKASIIFYFLLSVREHFLS